MAWILKPSSTNPEPLYRIEGGQGARRGREEGIKEDLPFMPGWEKYAPRLDEISFDKKAKRKLAELVFVDPDTEKDLVALLVEDLRDICLSAAVIGEARDVDSSYRRRDRDGLDAVDDIGEICEDLHSRLLSFLEADSTASWSLRHAACEQGEHFPHDHLPNRLQDLIDGLAAFPFWAKKIQTRAVGPPRDEAVNHCYVACPLAA